MPLELFIVKIFKIFCIQPSHPNMTPKSEDFTEKAWEAIISSQNRAQKEKHQHKDGMRTRNENRRCCFLKGTQRILQWAVRKRRLVHPT